MDVTAKSTIESLTDGKHEVTLPNGDRRVIGVRTLSAAAQLHLRRSEENRLNSEKVLLTTQLADIDRKLESFKK